MKCKVCGVAVDLDLTEGDGVWTVFCSPQHAHEWQGPRSEDQIIAETSGWGMPYDRCQWCSCTLKGGWHDKGCPVREYAIKVREAATA